jgi:U3 small nucleolar RNA-associated protein 14
MTRVGKIEMYGKGKKKKKVVIKTQSCMCAVLDAGDNIKSIFKKKKKKNVKRCPPQ